MITVRLLEPGDAGVLTALYGANCEFLAPWEPARSEDFVTVRAQHALLTGALAGYAAGHGVPMMIMDDDRPVGRINLSDIVRGAFQSAHLGYWVARDDNSRGVATAAVAAIIEVAFDDLGLHRVQAGTLVENQASQRVLIKNGFEQIGLAPAYLKIAGRWQDHILYQRINPAMD